MIVTNSSINSSSMCKTSGRVDQERVVAGVARVLERFARQFERIVRLRLFKDRLASRFRDDLQLFARRRPVNVGRKQQRLSLLILREPPRDLSRRSRLARTLQADNHDDVRRRLRENQSRRLPAKQFDQLIKNYFDDLL